MLERSISYIARTVKTIKEILFLCGVLLIIKLSEHPASPHALCYISTLSCWVNCRQISWSSVSHTSSNPHHQVLSVGSCCRERLASSSSNKSKNLFSQITESWIENQSLLESFFTHFHMIWLKQVKNTGNMEGHYESIKLLVTYERPMCTNCGYLWLRSRITSFSTSVRRHRLPTSRSSTHPQTSASVCPERNKKKGEECFSGALTTSKWPDVSNVHRRGGGERSGDKQGTLPLFNYCRGSAR